MPRPDAEDAGVPPSPTEMIGAERINRKEINRQVIVWRQGVFCKDPSTLEPGGDVDAMSSLLSHVIHLLTSSVPLKHNL